MADAAGRQEGAEEGDPMTLLAHLLRLLTGWLQRPDPRIPPALKVIEPGPRGRWGT